MSVSARSLKFRLGLFVALAAVAMSVHAASATTMTLVDANVGVSSFGDCEAAASISQAYLPGLPAIAAGQAVSGKTMLRIQLNPDGALVANEVAQSSGNPWIDQEALLAARLSRFAPEVQGCNHVGGTYSLLVDFTTHDD